MTALMGRMGCMYRQGGKQMNTTIDFNQDYGIYEQMLAAGVETGNHASDLYVPVTPTSIELVARYEFKRNVKIFRNNIDGTRWYDIPFAYTPYWEERARR